MKKSQPPEKTQNITLALPRTLLKKVKLLAVERDRSISGLLADTLREMVEQDDDYERAKRRSLWRLQHPFDMGTGGKATWTRDELHERR